MEQGDEKTYSASVGRLVRVKSGARASYAELFGDDMRSESEQKPAYVEEISEIIDQSIVEAFCERREVNDDDWEDIRRRLEPNIAVRYAERPRVKDFFYGRLEYMRSLIALLPYAPLAQQEILDKKKIPYDLLV